MHGTRLLYHQLLQTAHAAGVTCGWATVCAEGFDPHQGWRSEISETGVNELPVIMELAGSAAAIARWHQAAAARLPAGALLCTGGQTAAATGQANGRGQEPAEGAARPSHPLCLRPSADAEPARADGGGTDGWLEVRVLTRTDAQLEGQPAYAWVCAWLAAHGAVWQAVQRGLDGFAPGWEPARRSALWRAASQPLAVLAYGPSRSLQPALSELAALLHKKALVLSRCVQRWP
ncbi:MAG: DUF190 domain-containing protein [Alicyclobacillus sp.]|nr:DUF190 domain-containing protein [Alicyclobacillus sp.]